ncbi:MAG TPA: peptidylprolyl isomerase, partial [Planctomycetota bacterium]|nr:peptidylprolyl isomerase [Planctomycetota bacterium]
EAVADEVARRRAEAEADPRYQGVLFEELLRAQGLDVERLGRDPAVRVSALAHRYVDEKYGEAGLREAYATERQLFEDRFGEALRVRMLFLLATAEPNPIVPRSYAEAEELLRDLAARATSEALFAQLCKLHSEDPLSRQRGGDLGYVTRGDERVPAALRTLLFELAGSGDLAEPPSGPHRVENGALLVWISERRPSPDWAGMEPHVHRELRRRFLRSTLAPEDLVTYLDREDPEPGG